MKNDMHHWTAFEISSLTFCFWSRYYLTSSGHTVKQSISGLTYSVFENFVSKYSKMTKGKDLHMTFEFVISKLLEVVDLSVIGKPDSLCYEQPWPEQENNGI